MRVEAAIFVVDVTERKKVIMELQRMLIDRQYGLILGMEV